MRRVEIIFLIVVVATLLLSCQKPPETADSIARRVVEAHGGAKALSEARGFLFHGHVQNLIEDKHAKVWILFRRPGELRVIAEMDDAKEDRLFLDGAGWIDSGSGFEKATGISYDLLEFQSEHLRIPFGLQQGFYRLELLDQVVEGEPVRLRLTDPDGAEMTITIDPINSVVRKVERELVVQGENATFGVVYEDYRPVKGMQVPFRMINFVNGKPIVVTSFQSIQTNPSVPEKVFSPPGSG